MVALRAYVAILNADKIMADEADNASDSYEHHVHISLMNHRNKMKVATVSLTECESCGEEIPEARRVAIPGCTVCIDCMESYERKRGY